MAVAGVQEESAPGARGGSNQGGGAPGGGGASDGGMRSMATVLRCYLSPGCLR